MAQLNLKPSQGESRYCRWQSTGGAEKDRFDVVTVSDGVRLARPGHWIKNVLVLLPVVFALLWMADGGGVGAGVRCS